MYNENPTDVDTRVGYYNVQGVPSIVVSGLEQTILFRLMLAH